MQSKAEYRFNLPNSDFPVFHVDDWKTATDLVPTQFRPRLSVSPPTEGTKILHRALPSLPSLGPWLKLRESFSCVLTKRNSHFHSNRTAHKVN